MAFLREAVRERVEREGLRPFAKAIDVPVGRVRSVKDGRITRSDTIERLADALSLEFYIGPPRGVENVDAIRQQLRGVARELDKMRKRALEWAGPRPKRGLSPDTAAAIRAAIEGTGNENLPPDARPVSVVELAAAAGGGAESLGDEAVGHVWFRRDWLDRRGLDPTQCAVIGVRGESMEPALPDGCSILVDRTRRKPVDGRIYVVQTGDGVVVKRAGETKDGWELRSDHPSWEPAPWPGDAETVGQVVWTARSLV